MAIWDDTLGAISGGFGGTTWIIVLMIIVVGVAFLILGLGAWWYFVKKKWNLKAEIKLTRSGGNLTNAEWGKASFNAKRGVCYVKRPGWNNRAIAVPIFDIRKYIQGDNIVSFLQVGPEDLRPILNESWEEYVDDKPMKDKDGNYILDTDGKKVYEKASVLNIKVDPGLNKAWAVAWRQAAKQAYSLKSFFTQFQTPIAIAIVIIAVFVGFTMVWTRLGTICG